jgi:hypothetical protein
MSRERCLTSTPPDLSTDNDGLIPSAARNDIAGRRSPVAGRLL